MPTLHYSGASEHSQIAKCDPKSREGPGSFLPPFASVPSGGRATDFQLQS